MSPRKFQKLMWQFYHLNRRDFPWRRTTNPYRILVSEIMLQQTQTDRVGPYYRTWIKQFPNFEKLAAASLGEVLRAWQGLGYNRRALALKRLAEIVVKEYRGKLPKHPEELQKLPGIGPYTSRAIATFAWNQPGVFIETNIRRVYLYHFFPKSRKVADDKLRPIIEATLDHKNSREWYYALMDYGAWLAKTVKNPNHRSRHYAKQSKFEGSHRQVRGTILRVVSGGPTTIARMKKEYPAFSDRLEKAVEELTHEGFIKRQGQRILTS